MSATLGDTTRHRAELSETSPAGRWPRCAAASARCRWTSSTARRRCTRRSRSWSSEAQAPVYLVNFTQRAAAEQAQNLMSVELLHQGGEGGDPRRRSTDARFDTPYGKELQRFLRHGIGLHHAGLLPKYRLLVEKLAQEGLLKVISGTDTLGVGVNIPIRTVLFTQLCKYDGEKTGHPHGARLPADRRARGPQGLRRPGQRGRAGARARDREPQARGRRRRQGKKVVMQKPPQKGYVALGPQHLRAAAERSRPSRSSRASRSPTGMLLDLLQSDRARAAAATAAGRADRRARTAREHQKRAAAGARAALFRALRRGGHRRASSRTERCAARWCEVSTELQRDFSLHHTLSLYLLETLRAARPRRARPTRSTSSRWSSPSSRTPTSCSTQQLDKLKSEKVAELKAQGVEYDERMEELEKLEHPKPHRDFIYGTFNEFAAKHPWVGQENIRPKSVARDMFERFATFHDYVRDYGLQRSEGVLLRYLSDVYKTLVQTVPETLRDRGASTTCSRPCARTLREVDSSLLDEWERLQQPGGGAAARATPSGGPVGPTAREISARDPIRVHRLLKAIAEKAWDDALACLAPGHGWTAESLASETAPYFAAHERIVLTPEARRPSMAVVRSDAPGHWEARQRSSRPTARRTGRWTVP